MFLIGFAGSANITTGTSTIFNSVPTLIVTLNGRLANMTSLLNTMSTQINAVSTEVTVALDGVSALSPYLVSFANRMGTRPSQFLRPPIRWG